MSLRRSRRLGFVDITDPSAPKPAGTLAVGGEPTSVADLGRLLLAVHDVSSEGKDASIGIRGIVQLYGFGCARHDRIVSRNDIPWGALSALSAVPDPARRPRPVGGVRREREPYFRYVFGGGWGAWATAGGSVDGGALAD